MSRFMSIALMAWWLVFSPTDVLTLSSGPVPETITWTTGTGKWKGQWGRRENLLCAPDIKLEPIWGTGVYTDDSPVCSAAVHAGGSHEPQAVR